MRSASTISIIICTCNRAAALQATLRSVGNLTIPEGFQGELIVVDNASTDGTAIVVRGTRLSNLAVRYTFEPKRGQSNARNAGLAEARGEIILFTDDDVRPSPDWIVRMTAPLVGGGCDAVVGNISLAPDLVRPWLTAQHKLWLATPENQFPRRPLELIGANMGFRRFVLERVPAFDPELGPGALGFGDDTLFSSQLHEAGFRMEFVDPATVIHHLEP